MYLARILFGALTTWCSIHAITVPIDRADVKLSPTRSSMIANGWRPLTNYDGIGTNVSPSSNLERNAAKLHDHIQSTSEKIKPQTKGSKPQEYSPPSILGSFSVFGHAATMSRSKPKEHPKQSTSATSHYSFLVPPPRDSYRFEIDPHRKTIIRDNDAFLRQPSFISQSHQSDINASPFFSKGSGFTTSTTHSPSFSKGRPFIINSFGVPQSVHSHVRQGQQQQIEAQKSSNTKSYLQPPGLENSQYFAKEINKNVEGTGFARFQNQPHSAQISNGGNGNFYSQVDHPPHFKGTFERDPSFLVHESHEISYATPSSSFGYNFRPSLPYDNLVPHNSFASTTPPKAEASKYTSLPSGVRNDHYKQYEVNGNAEESVIKAQGLSHGLPPGTYYLQSEQRPSSSWPQQKSKYTTEINEVLPRKNPPAKFRPENSRPNPIFAAQPQVNAQPEVIYIRPNSLPSQFENPVSIAAGQVQQSTSSEPEYETPESISLKHFNEQQYLLQQQLVQQDRQRYQEHELQRQREQQQRQEEEVRKRQEEIRIFEQQEKEAERKKLEEQLQKQRQQEDEQERQKLQERYELQRQHEMQEQIELRKQQQAQEQRAKEQLEQRRQELLREQLEEQKKIHEQQFAVQQEEYNRPITSEDHNPTQEVHKPSQETPESTVTEAPIKVLPEQHHTEVQPQGEQEVRPYKPKFPQRGPTRRRKPLTPPGHAVPSTEASVPEISTYLSLTDAPALTTVEAEDVTTVPVTLRPRVRRPGQTLKRRRPFSTTTAPQSESSSADTSSIQEPESAAKYQAFDNDFAKRRRVRPTQPTVVSEEAVTERHLIRKRPSGHRQRVNPGEPFEAEVVTEIVRPTRIIYKDTTEWENYPESFKKKDSQEIDTSSLPSQTLAGQDMEQVATENGQVFEFSTETHVPEDVTRFEEQIRGSGPTQVYENDGNIALEQLFDKSREKHAESLTNTEDVSAATAPTTTSTTTTTTTTQAPTTTTEVASTTRQSHRIRPLKYGNSTRPRFSIKDYKSRLDYKNRLSQGSTTEASAVSPPSRRRTTTEKPEESSAGTPRETTGRYKYMSRISYKSTTPSTVSGNPEGDEEQTPERVNRFMPKRKLNTNLYRSRVVSTTPQASKLTNEENRQSTTRPENIYSSAIRRPRPTYRNRNQPETAPTEEATEMTAEETSFYSSMTTPRVKESFDAIPVAKEDHEDDKNEESTSSLKEGTNDVGLAEKIDESTAEVDDGQSSVPEDSNSGVTLATPTRRMQEEQPDEEAVSQNESIPTIPVWTEPSRDAEDALISQRIANLTSSASELSEPGMFKAVSPASESRVISPHFAIVTDEPTLPIEAFFQVLAKKDE